MEKKIEDYLKQHYLYFAIVHLIAGAGVGILITYPLIGQHPLRWGVGLIILGVLGIFYPLFR